MGIEVGAYRFEKKITFGSLLKKLQILCGTRDVVARHASVSRRTGCGALQ